jgi:hypothetical protein
VNQLLHVNIPILMIHGDADQASAVEGSRLVQEAFKKAGKTNLIYIEYPDLDHHWVDSKGNSHGLEVMADIGKWIMSKGGFPKIDADLKVYNTTVAKMKIDFEQTPANRKSKF